MGEEPLIRFAKWIFLLVGAHGVVAVTPLCALEGTIARLTGPLTHPEYFYGNWPNGLCRYFELVKPS